jgi:hypothetical protein
VFARTTLAVAALAIFLGVTQIAAAHVMLDPEAERAPAPPPSVAGPHALSGSIAQTDQTWVCRGPVDLDTVTVTMTGAIRSRKGADAVHLEPGCTGEIRHLEVLTAAGDAVKVADGAHDLAIDGGTVRCVQKLPTMHQDGIQVMGGARITFRNLSVDCGRAGESLINSNLFIKKAGRSTSPPTDILCVDCRLGGDAAHTASIQESIRSGLVDSTLCSAKYANLTLTIGAAAVDPVDVDNTVGGC